MVRSYLGQLITMKLKNLDQGCRRIKIVTPLICLDIVHNSYFQYNVFKKKRGLKKK